MHERKFPNSGNTELYFYTPNFIPLQLREKTVNSIFFFCGHTTQLLESLFLDQE